MTTHNGIHHLANAPDAPVAQPLGSPDLPWQRDLPRKLYEPIIAMPDEVVLERMSEVISPVAIAD